MMTREAKIGLMMVAVLVGVFGFLVYKRIHRPMDLRAEQKVLNEDATVANQDDFPPQRNDFALPDRSQSSSKVVRDAKAIARDVEDLAEDVVEEVGSFVEKKVRSEKRSIPNDFSDDVDVVNVAELEPPRADRAQRAEFRPRKADPVKVEEESPFDDSPIGLPSSEITLVSSSNETESDPIDQPVGGRQNSTEESQGEPYAEDRVKQPLEARRHTRPVIEEDDRTEFPPQRAYADAEPFESTPRGRREAAPHRLNEDLANSNHTGSVAATAQGPKYTIQPNDNFWIISRKRYGAGRFYMALAEHNRNVIPDPKRMMPGVVISTPEVEQLEREFASIIPKPAAADVVLPVAAVRTPKVDQGPPGFFVSREGHPMYRVGDKDTLTEIAKVHLNRSTRWVQILEMNRNVLRDGNELKIGMVLRLPADASRVRVAESQRDFR